MSESFSCARGRQHLYWPVAIVQGSIVRPQVITVQPDFGLDKRQAVSLALVRLDCKIRLVVPSRPVRTVHNLGGRSIPAAVLLPAKSHIFSRHSIQPWTTRYRSSLCLGTMGRPTSADYRPSLVRPIGLDIRPRIPTSEDGNWTCRLTTAD
ncbi:hypothetical protein C8Q76DRAFT_763615 [Earliella scabrosa]|nr:hypothetical protein C8Q76DRAFT_763615 [Earliella scabrosa]